jgi:hypothetical protein
MPAKKADSFESDLWTDDSTSSHGEQTVSRPNVHGVCEANGRDPQRKSRYPMSGGLESPMNTGWFTGSREIPS